MPKFTFNNNKNQNLEISNIEMENQIRKNDEIYDSTNDNIEFQILSEMQSEDCNDDVGPDEHEVVIPNPVIEIDYGKRKKEHKIEARLKPHIKNRMKILRR